jgi:DNA-binding NtrC family response regulator
MKNEKSIFIVDDDPFWTAVLSQVLSNLGYENLVTYNNGADCIADLPDDPALIFLDYQMEDMNGLEVLKLIKDRNPSIGVIFCTAHEDLGVAIDAMKYGSFDFLLKANATKEEVSSIIDNISKSQVFTRKIY